jgi:uncharacterized membrane protein
MWGQDDWSWWAWPVMTLMMLAIAALIVWVVVSIARARVDQEPPRPDASAILAERFARGEIDKGEYEGAIQTIRLAQPVTAPEAANKIPDTGASR